MSFIRKNPRLVSILNAVAFAAGGVDALESMGVAIGVVHFAVAAVNLVAARFILQHSRWMNFLIFMVNALFAGFLAGALYAAGRHRLQYAWMLICLLNLVGGIVKFIVQGRRERARADA